MEFAGKQFRTDIGWRELDRAVPELPETETIARDLDREVAGARIVSASRSRRADVLREVTRAQFVARVTGATIERCWRRAKLVVLDCRPAIASSCSRGSPARC